MKPSLRPSIATARPGGAATQRVLTRRSARRVLRYVESLPSTLIEALWHDPDALCAAAPAEIARSWHVTPVKAGDRTTIVRLDDPAAPDRSFILKRYNRMDQLHTMTHLAMRSRAAWSWHNARKLLAAGLSTPAPLAYVEERRAGVLRLRSWLLTQFVPGRSLRDVVATVATASVLHDLASQFAAIWQRLGQLRIGHGDMKATNFIVEEPREARGALKLWLLDLDGMRTYRSSVMLRRERRNDLGRFMRNWEGRPEVEAIFRARIGTG